jgi:5'-nucleotidase
LHRKVLIQKAESHFETSATVPNPVPAVPQPAGNADAHRRAHIKAPLEQQWADPKRPRILQVSKGFSYAWDNAADGSRVIAARMMLNGRPIEMARSYRVTVNGFLAVGGDGFTELKNGTSPQVGVYDVDALDAYLKANSPVAPGAMDRIARVN